MPPVDAAGLTQCFNAQNTMVADAICRGFGVTAGSYSVPDPATEQVSGPFAWAAPGAPGSANPGVLVFRGKRVSGATVTFGPDYCRQANVFMSDNPLNWDSTTVPVVGLNLQYHNTTAPVVRAGPAQVIPWGTTATLTGTVSDDGLPNPPALTTVRWWQGSGPGTVLFADPNAPSTTVTFSQPGTYLLNLEATDGELNSVDWVQIVVLGNQPPVVWARPDQILSTGMTLNLAASVSDDGMPNPPAVTTANWSMSSGPAPVVFSDASSAATSVRFTQFGTYVLRLTASDSELSAFQEATIQVHPDPPGDFSGDGHVTGVDFLIWQTHYPMLGGATKLMGDGNGDGRVTGMDFILWQIDYGCEHS
jgi:hypothetical protein